MKYRAQVFSDSFPNGRVSADVDVSFNRLSYEIDGQFFEVDLNTSEIKPGGFDHDMIYVYPRNSSGHSAILFPDKNILKLLKESSDQGVADKVSLVNRKMTTKKNWKIIGIGLIVSFFLFIGLLVTGVGVNSLIVKFIPVEWDVKLGELGYQSALSSMAPGAPKEKNKVVLNAVKKIEKRLIKAIGKTPFKYNFTIIDAPVENAFALPGGKVVIFTGILKKADSADEIAGILAHEIMHVEKRHAMKQIARSLGVVAILNIFLGDVEGVSGVILHAGSELLTLGYSRSMEEEADTEGFKLLSRAGVSGDGFIHFFDKMAEEEKGSKPPEWLMTHPVSEKRAAFLKELSKKYKPENPQSLKINWAIVKKNI